MVEFGRRCVCWGRIVSMKVYGRDSIGDGEEWVYGLVGCGGKGVDKVGEGVRVKLCRF